VRTAPPNTRGGTDLKGVNAHRGAGNSILPRFTIQFSRVRSYIWISRFHKALVFHVWSIFKFTHAFEATSTLYSTRIAFANGS
jgi:hypothetical protein